MVVWPWIEAVGEKLVKASEIEALAVSYDIDNRKYKVVARTKSDNLYTITVCDTKEEAQKELLEVAEVIARVEEQTLERA